MLYRHNTTYIPRRAYDLSLIANITLMLILTVNVVDKLAIKWQYDNDMAYRDSIMRPVLSITTTRTEYRDKEIPQETIDTWVDKYVRKYFVGYQVSEMKMIMHCLLHRESGHQPHDANGPHGDSGKAGGILQFHQPTWERMRGQMLKANLIDEIGSRYNPEQAIHTTAWAIKNGRAKEWGPILRDSKGSDYAACQLPSWYK